MLFLANENSPGEAVEALRQEGHDVAWVRTDAPGAADQEVLKRAQKEVRGLLTFDKDFGELGVSNRQGVWISSKSSTRLQHRLRPRAVRT